MCCWLDINEPRHMVMVAIMRILLIWIFWLALVIWWLSPEIASVKDRVAEHNVQIEKMINE